MVRTGATPVSITIPNVASLSDEDMAHIAPYRDGRWSNQTKELQTKLGAKELDLNRGWASTWTEWSCPCCKRNKGQIARMTSEGVLLCQLEHHHDHLDDFMKKLFQDIDPVSDDLDIRVQISRAESALRPLVERFERVLICDDCNLADGHVKRELRSEIDPHFTFTPSEINGFITIRDNRQHEVDLERARATWIVAREDFFDRVDFAKRMARRIADGRHKREVAPGRKLHGQLQTKEICFRLLEMHTPDLHRLHLGEAIEARSVARDGVGRAKKPRKTQGGNPPTESEFAALDAEQSSTNKHWRNAGEAWQCACCDRSKREICRQSNRGKWTARIHRLEEFKLETDSEQLWRRRLDGAGDIVISAPQYELVCQDCREIIAKLRQRRPNMDARALTLENLRELAEPAATNVAHDVNFERAEQMVAENASFLNAIGEFEAHKHRIADIWIEFLRLKMAGCGEAKARDLIGFEIAKTRDWEIDEGDEHADWLLEEAARLRAFTNT